MFSSLNGRSKEKKLRKAAKKGELSSVKALLDEGVDLTASDKDGRPALHLASYYGHLDVVRELLGREACDVTLPDEYGSTALHLAIRWKLGSCPLIVEPRGVRRECSDKGVWWT
ncbi:hypothetical protein Poli38472_001885 [Pythium oligandrum]|uniref:Uncharacterized protein n=1 Tax=Pythium oligandrum TaxID=41045 RepID=A0A8K1CUE9_PYTOL|nr:hypothetical protein Poli38472_001885 [Pythium oligandrum]|eukprot:TMW69729.1 hypothetical protein Poli38472_001885 [Pythium oligandrum]